MNRLAVAIAVAISAAIGGLLVPGITLHVPPSMRGDIPYVGLLVLWPSSILLVATKQLSHAESLLALIISAAFNAALYAALTFAALCAFWPHKRHGDG